MKLLLAIQIILMSIVYYFFKVNNDQLLLELFKALSLIFLVSCLKNLDGTLVTVKQHHRD